MKKIEAKRQSKKSFPVKKGKNIAPKPEGEQNINPNPMGIGNPPPTKPAPPKK